MPTKLHPAFAVHPGAWLRTEIVDPHGLTVTGTAQKLGVTRQAMSKLLNADAALTVNMATRLQTAFGVKAASLLRMQAAHNLAQARLNETKI